jgi:hypothetical protein
MPANPEIKDDCDDYKEGPGVFHYPPNYRIRGHVVLMEYPDLAVPGDNGPVGNSGICGTQTVKKKDGSEREMMRASTSCANKHFEPEHKTPPKNTVGVAYKDIDMAYTMRHELAHSLGIGNYDLFDGLLSSDKEGIVGPNGLALWRKWSKNPAAPYVPISKAYDGGDHFKDPEFESPEKERELNTPFGIGPLSQMTLEVLKDLGYTLSASAAPEKTQNKKTWAPIHPIQTRRRLEEAEEMVVEEDDPNEDPEARRRRLDRASDYAAAKLKRDVKKGSVANFKSPADSYDCVTPLDG